jgi:integrase
MLGGLYRLARARKIVTRSPLDELDPAERPRSRSKERPRLDERSLAAIVRHAEEPYRIGIALLAWTGIRHSEALAVRWRDVDLVELELQVRGQWTRGTRQTHARVEPRKANGTPYTTLILPALEAELTRRLEAELPEGRGG